ncbi:tetratricopeptide repeat protein 22-like [Ptychodera flava]|uniref:tetratricopeptide repeat protein 22-like n=1 Tax=Ptychodera flava TaxID=63121 RepID=UPI00396A1A26
MASQLRKLPSSPDDCGHFRLPLLLLSENIDKRSVNARYDSLTKQLENETGYFCHGLSNMLGLLEFQKGETVKACQTFKEILEKDPTNLNALSNLTTVYERMNRKRKAKDYRDKLTEVFKDKGRIFREERQAALLRCIAEQAFSLAFDCYDEKTKMPPNYEEAISMYENVLRETENLAALDGERYKWKMCILICRYNRLAKQEKSRYKSVGEEKKATDEVIAMLQILKDILDNCGDGFYRSQCWCYIGMLLIKERHLMDARSQPENYKKLRQLHLVDYYERPTLCFEDADRCYEGGWKELVKFAKFLIKDKQYENALQVIEKSLSKNPANSNWHAYEQRAIIYTKMYDEQFQRLAKQGEAPDKTLLTKAEEDFDLCLEVMDYNPMILLEMVRVQIRLCQDQKRPRFDYKVEDMDALEKAFEILTKVANTGDLDDFGHAQYMMLHGECLMYAKEYSDAAAKYEEALKHSHRSYSGNFSALLRALFHRLQQHEPINMESTDDLAAIVNKIMDYNTLYDKQHAHKVINELSLTFREEFREVDKYASRTTGMNLHQIIDRSSTHDERLLNRK